MPLARLLGPWVRYYSLGLDTKRAGVQPDDHPVFDPATDLDLIRLRGHYYVGRRHPVDDVRGTIAATPTRPPQETALSGQKVSEDEMQALNITTSAWHGEWNYAIAPQAE